jgi:5-methyltetrahydropteroyltriglutamate--homocysteine methyltransferase
MVTTTVLGYPRIGAKRELKWALEAYFSGQSSLAELEWHSARIVRANIEAELASGLDVVPAGDFSLYDHVLDAALEVGLVPQRFEQVEVKHELERYFLMARGRVPSVAQALRPLEMTKWFDTNYHYLVPELEAGSRFEYRPGRLAAAFRLARDHARLVRPAVLGPVSLLLLSKDASGAGAKLARLPELVEAYAAMLAHLAELGADFVQLDEPCLVQDLDSAAETAFRAAYERLSHGPARVFLSTFFGGIGERLGLVSELPVHAIHVDAVSAPADALALATRLGADKVLSLGVIDGRNVWRTELEAALTLAERARDTLGSERLWLAPSCSLLHVPLDLTSESALDPEVSARLAFARQKLDELELVRRGLEHGRAPIAEELEASRRARAAWLASTRRRDPEVRARLAAIPEDAYRRKSPSRERRAIQRRALGLPPLPTTTIGSFPQTDELRKARAGKRSGALDPTLYRKKLEQVVSETIALQERIGLDVLVHGEPERNDMVEYFGERLSGMSVTEAGWVQSYGSRCVKPPIIYGDVRRLAPLTVDWAAYAQKQTSKPVKGMLTGPVTLLKWSFVRDDESPKHTASTLALALRDEIAELEAAGIAVIQVDEPAFREALPLRRSERPEYLDWAVHAFRLATAGALDRTQIHTHMCYCDFADIIDAIADLDADVISIESARSAMDLLAVFRTRRYPNDIGLGLYDIHSPRVPEESEMSALLESALEVLDPAQVWVNPDCGLKTRSWAEALPALERMVEAARRARTLLARRGSLP